MSSGTPTTDPIIKPRSIEELTSLAGSQVDTEAAAAESPLQSQISTLQGRETSTLQQIGSMFGTLQPYVAGEADKVQSAYDTGFQATQSIFNTAQQRMAQLKQQRAQEAQAMAQEMGGPVAVGEFTASVLGPEQELAATAPNVLLHSLANAEAGTQEARAFSEKVFPLVRTEQEAQARNGFEQKIREIEDQISSLEAGKQGQKNSRLNDLLQQERSFDLNRNQLALDKLKANRDWQATLRSLHNDDARLAMARKQFKLQEAGLTGTYKGKPTLSAIKATIAERQASQRLGLQQAALQEKMRHAQETEAIQKRRLGNQTQKNAMAILDHAFAPSGKASLTLSKRINVNPKDPAQAGVLDQILLGKIKDAHRDPKTGQWYYYGKQTLTPAEALAQGYNLGGNTPITDPQQLYDLLIGSNTPSAMALKLVRLKTGVNDFTPGGTTNYTPEVLSGMTNRQIAGIAKERGYKGGAKRGALITYILQRNPNSPSLSGLPRP